MSDRSERRAGSSLGDDRPSEAVLDELLRMFQADDLTRGADIDLNSPEVEELLAASTPHPRPESTIDDGERDPKGQSFGPRDVERSTPGDEGSASDEEQSSEGSERDQYHGSASDEAAWSDSSETGVTTETKPSETSITASETSILVIEEDDLPDVSFLDEDDVDAAADGAVAVVAERQRVFIDDDSKIAEIVGSAEDARASGIEPKLRERRAAVLKAQERKRLRWVLAAVVLLALLVAGLAVLGSSLFSIENVSVSDAVYSRDQLQPIVDDLTGEPTLRADTHTFEERIERIPWVEEARVRTRFPDSASIEVRERVPAATFQGGDGGFRVIDTEGRVLDVVDGQPVQLMLVRSANPPSPEPGEFTPSGFVAAAAMARALTPTVQPITEEIEVANDGSDVRLHLVGGTEVRLGSGDDLVDKLARLETVIDMDSERLPARIDVSTDKVTVQETASG